MTATIHVKSQQKKIPFTPFMRSYIRASITDTLIHEGIEDDSVVNVTLVDDETIKEMNAEFRNKDSATDVLSFPLLDGEYTDDDLVDGYLMLGDVVISMETADRQAKEYGHSINEELAFLCVHSTLHLLGYDHELSEEDEDEMFAVQDEIMKKFRGRK